MNTIWFELTIAVIIFGLGVAFGISFMKRKIMKQVTEDVDFRKVPLKGILQFDARIGFAFRDGKYTQFFLHDDSTKIVNSENAVLSAE